MKKVLVGLTVLGLMAMVAGSASAGLFDWCCGSDGQTVENSGATVNNNVSATSRTGGNDIRNQGGRSDDNTIITGNATSVATADNFVNSNLIEGCCDGGDQTVEDSGATVNNTVRAKAKTGGNDIKNKGSYCWFFGSSSDDNTVITGSADSWAEAFTVVNSNIRRGF